MRHAASHLTALLIALTLLTLGLSQPANSAPSATPRMMLVLDSSGSMADPDASGAPKIDAARTALGGVIGSLPEAAAVGLRVFGATIPGKTATDEACRDTQRVVEVGDGKRAELLAAIGNYKPFG